MSDRQRTAGYIRVSSEMQFEGHSIDAQRAEIARYCEREGHHLLRTNADEGVSAHTHDIARRPQLAALLEDTRGGAFDVVVHTIDRWARNVGVQRQALQLLGTAGGLASPASPRRSTSPPRWQADAHDDRRRQRVLLRPARRPRRRGPAPAR